MANPILTKSNSEKPSSPEQLNDYIRVSGFGVWLILGTIMILLVSVLVWGVFGSLQTSVRARGYSDKGAVTCYLASPDGIAEGNEVKIGDVTGEVTHISENPVKSSDVQKKYDEYTAYSLNLSDWNYVVEISAKGCADGVVDVNIIGESVKPLSFIMG